MNNSMSLLFYVRKSKLLKHGTVPVYLRITVGGSRFEVATQRYVDLKRWNSEGQKVAGTNQEARSVNSYLKALEQQVYTCCRDLMIEGLPLDTKNLKGRLFGR